MKVQPNANLSIILGHLNTYLVKARPLQLAFDLLV